MPSVRLLQEAQGFMDETPFISQATAGIVTAFSNCEGDRTATFRLGDVWADLQFEKLSVLFGRNRSRLEALAGELVFQRLFRQGNACGVFCPCPQDFVKGQLALLSEVGIEKLYSGEIHSDDWGYIAHAIECIKAAPLYLGNMPPTFVLLKDAVRHYASNCKVINREAEDSPAVIFGLDGLLGDATSLDSALSELEKVAGETDVPIVVVHHAGEDAEGEHLTFLKHSGAILTLESSSTGGVGNSLSIQLKRNLTCNLVTLGRGLRFEYLTNKGALDSE